MALRPEWEALWRSAANATPFQSPAWLLPWWSVFGTHRPMIATLRDAARLIGVLPLYVLDEPPARKLLPLGAGVSDYHDVLLAPDAPPAATHWLLQAALAAADSDRVTECALLELPPHARLMTAAVPAGWKEEPGFQIPCPVLELPPSPDGLRACIPAGRLRDVRQYRHRAEREGGWSIETADLENVEELLSVLIRLHRQRWESRGEAGILADPRVAAFHYRAATELIGAGLLRFQAIRVRGSIAAAFYALLGDDGVMFYLSGFDPRLARLSPGTILLGHMIDQAVAEGRRKLHFLRGAESYKYAWGARDRMNTTRRLVPA